MPLLTSLRSAERRAGKDFTGARRAMGAPDAAKTLDTRIELVRALRELGNKSESDKIIAELLSEFEGDEDQLQKIDCLLDEPCSAKNKALVAQINKDGITFYEAKDFGRAVDCFTSALQDFPQHIGLRLNLVQALMGHFKQEPDKAPLLTAMHQTMDYMRKIIPDNHAQFRRFRQLEELLHAITASAKSAN